MRHLLFASTTIGRRRCARSLPILPRDTNLLRRSPRPRPRLRPRFVGIASSSSTTTGDDDSPAATTADGENDVSSPPRFEAPSAWRRDQLSKLERKFSRGTDGGDGDGAGDENDEGPLEIKSDDELQQVWRDMESRVTRRRSLTREERGPGKFGRRNVKRTDEDAWLGAGLYGDGDGDGAEGEGKDPNSER